MRKLLMLLLGSAALSLSGLATQAQTTQAATQPAPNPSADQQPAPIVRSAPPSSSQAAQNNPDGSSDPRDYRENDRTGPMTYPVYSYVGGPYTYGYAPYGYAYPYPYAYPFGFGVGFYGYPGYYRGYGFRAPYGYGFRGPYGYGGARGFVAGGRRR